MRLLGDPVVDEKMAFRKTVVHVALVEEGAVAVFGIVAGQGEIGQAMQPGVVDGFIIVAKFFDPGWGQMLRHDVFNGIDAFVAFFVHILPFDGATIFKAFQDVHLIFAFHWIDGPRGKSIYKFLVIWEANTVELGKQRVFEFFQIVVVGAIVTNDFTMQGRKDFVERIGWQVADRSTEKIIFCVKENIFDIHQRQLPL